MTLAAVRVRGAVNVRGDIKDTLRMLRLTRPNHCVVLPATAAVEGMLRKAKDYITWGELRPEVLAHLLERRGRLRGGKPLSEAYVTEALGFGSLDELAEALAGGRTTLGDLDGLKPVFRLHPPRKGYEGVKRSFGEGGALGYRGEAINDLLLRMVG